MKPEKGYEIHHIHPRALEGPDDESNLVKLTIFEHCIAHYYLAKAVPCWKTLYPILRLSGRQVKNLSDLERLSLEEICQWSLLREQIRKMPKPPEIIEKLRTSHLGKTHTLEQKQLASVRMIGKILVNKDGRSTYIRSEEWPVYESDGWQKGQSEEQKKRSPEHLKKLNHKGKIAVNNGEYGKLIYPEELDKYLSEGWIRGRSPASKERLRKSHLGVATCTGYKYLHKETKEIKVSLDKVETYLAEGWEPGRATGFAERHKEALQKNGTTNIGKVRIKKDGVGKMVPKDQLQSYLDQGWEMGIVRH